LKKFYGYDGYAHHYYENYHDDHFDDWHADDYEDAEWHYENYGLDQAELTEADYPDFDSGYGPNTDGYSGLPYTGYKHSLDTLWN
jgi:hypothetical protein